MSTLQELGHLRAGYSKCMSSPESGIMERGVKKKSYEHYMSALAKKVICINKQIIGADKFIRDDKTQGSLGQTLLI